jgi:hypothetical protein
MNIVIANDSNAIRKRPINSQLEATTYFSIEHILIGQRVATACS